MKSGLEIICGPMFSGKTSLLLEKLSLFNELGFSVVYINSERDTRNESTFSSHNLLYNNAITIDSFKTSNLKLFNPEKYDIIGIDEAQFFDEQLVSTIIDWVDNKKKYVIICGLNGTFNRGKFGHVLDLIPFADNVFFKTAYCKSCVKNETNLVPAIFSKLINVGDTQNVINVGGSEKYQSVCRNCFLK